MIIHFLLFYEVIKSFHFHIYLVLYCRNLPKMDIIGASDPYVILELLPTSLYLKRAKEYKTSTRKRTLEPEFNESFQW